jgi:hypothetical protein
MTDRIQGAVAAILNRREVVLNIGSEDGVTEGVKFAILNPRGVEIHDPNTHEKIGSVEIPKVFVQATRVQEHLTVARTFVTKRKNVGGSGGIPLDIFRPTRYVEEPETLRTSDKPYVEELPEEESYVKVGDPVVQVIGDEFTLGD